MATANGRVDELVGCEFLVAHATSVVQSPVASITLHTAAIVTAAVQGIPAIACLKLVKQVPLPLKKLLQ